MSLHYKNGDKLKRNWWLRSIVYDEEEAKVIRAVVTITVNLNWAMIVEQIGTGVSFTEAIEEAISKAIEWENEVEKETV